MHNKIKNKHIKLLNSILGLMMSLVFITNPVVERNPQECSMIRVIGKNRKD